MLVNERYHSLLYNVINKQCSSAALVRAQKELRGLTGVLLASRPETEHFTRAPVQTNVSTRVSDVKHGKKRSGRAVLLLMSHTLRYLRIVHVSGAFRLIFGRSAGSNSWMKTFLCDGHFRVWCPAFRVKARTLRVN